MMLCFIFIGGFNYGKLKFPAYPRNVVWFMKLILKVSTINAVRDSVFGHPLWIIIAALSSDFGYFGHLFNVHLDPLPLVICIGYIRGLMVEPSFARSKPIV